MQNEVQRKQLGKFLEQKGVLLTYSESDARQSWVRRGCYPVQARYLCAGPQGLMLTVCVSGLTSIQIYGQKIVRISNAMLCMKGLPKRSDTC